MLGGSEGGDSFGEDSKQTFLDNGYHVISIGYFGMAGTPEHLNRIRIDSVHSVINKYKKHRSIDPNRIGILGVSKGGELALILGSLYSDIGVVIAAVPSHVSFQASNITLNSNSSWEYEGQEVPYVPYQRFSLATFKGIVSGEAYEYLDMHLEALENTEAVEAATIKVENSKAAILLVSGKHDHVWPSTFMSNEIIKRLTKFGYQHPYEHFQMNVDHYVLDYPESWKKILLFLNSSFGPNDKVAINE